ncbi:MAG: hypothetical protein K8823_44 [Cenarchaeum symbiont of Oopsacas minuta]|nr:hypothetical protein [Cenarchaeum symbiont of Oopsacas minuta]
MDLIPAEIKKHVRSSFAGKYNSQQLGFLVSIMSTGKTKTSPILRKRLFSHLQKNGLIEVKTTLTEKGKWMTMAYNLHISFFTLSALADFYCMQKSTGFAVSPKFLERFEPYYSPKYLANTISVLACKGFICHKQRHIWKIKPDVFRYLNKKYDKDLVLLKNWLDRTQDAADELVMKKIADAKNDTRYIFSEI